MPSLSRVLGDWALGLFIKYSYPNLNPEWRLTENLASIAFRAPSAVAVENMLPCFQDGSLASVHGTKRFLGGKSIELLNGQVLDDIEVVVLCTGYQADFSIVGPDAVATSVPEAHGYAKAGTKERGGTPLYRLWMDIFSPAHADSLALLCYSALGKSNGFSFADVTAMAVSNVFRGVHPLPSQAEMEGWVDSHQRWIPSCWAREHTIDPSMVKQWEYQSWLHEAAGTGMENLSYWGWKGWRFWWTDRKMYDLMAKGVESAHIYRYFESGKRKTWDGARDAVLKLDQELKDSFPLSREREVEMMKVDASESVKKREFLL